MGSNFTPYPENDKVIVARGWNEAEITKIIHDFIENYKDDGHPTYSVDIYKESEKLYRLTFPQDIHPQLFTFLINYLAYPFELDLNNRSIVIAGQTTLSSAFEGIDGSLLGEKAVLYLPENDEEYDVVYLRTESGIALSSSFNELRWKGVSDARLSSEVQKLIEIIQPS